MTYWTPEENDKLMEMMQNLTMDEIEIAAKASYEYLKHPDPSKTTYHFNLFALRFLRSKDGDVTKALERMKTTIEFRRVIDVPNIISSATEASQLEKDIYSESLYVQGYDKEGHSTYIFVPRKVRSNDKERTLRHHIYTLERAMAASKASDKSVNAVVDFKGFSLRNAPPLDVGKSFLTILRSHYIGQINRVFILDPPKSFYYLWTIFQPFVGTKTKSKICFVQSKTDDLAKHYEADQAPSWMMSSGTKNRELNVEEYLHNTPFESSFDDKQTSSEQEHQFFCCT